MFPIFLDDGTMSDIGALVYNELHVFILPSSLRSINNAMHYTLITCTQLHVFILPSSLRSINNAMHYTLITCTHALPIPQVFPGSIVAMVKEKSCQPDRYCPQLKL